MIEWLISFGNGCHYITMAFLLLYLLWLVRESFRTRKSGVVREEIMCSDDAGKCFLALCYNGKKYKIQGISDNDSTRHKRSFRKAGQCTRLY